MNGVETDLARFACATCRRQKRKCTRELPACQLCLKNRRQCEYPDDTPPGQQTENRSDSAPTVSSQRVFPALFFLDSYTFKQRYTAVDLAPISLPSEFMQLVEQGDLQVSQIIDNFFNSVHQFFPIVSKRWLSQHISTTGYRSSDFITLLHCMHALVPNSPSQPSPQVQVPNHRSLADAAYDKAKRCFQFVESRGIISVRLLQAALLLSLYEVSNAIYPPAFLTVGHCARLGQAMGIHDRRNVAQMFPVLMSWTAMEEIRRVWWGVIIMDRFANLGIRGRPFACDDARPEDLLPMDETLWDLGEQTVVPSLAVSSDTDLPAPAFARTCQAAHLLSRVLSHINSPVDPVNDCVTSRYSEALQLHQILSSFHLALRQEVAMDDPSAFAAYSSAIGISYSALIALCDNYTCADLDDPSAVGIPEQLRMQKTSLNSLHEIGTSVWEFASCFGTLQGEESNHTVASPFAADCLYAAATQYLWYIQETGKTELNAAVDDMKTALNFIGRTWAVGNEYLAILEGREL
ncbi:hypothetical protein BGZ63DRAFT_252260 [Mariannaea sp. PMI_226]|nr:hypothetical protein BGZ63DRAFT_252260 [Mariannaea sp. PMI_226]